MLCKLTEGNWNIRYVKASARNGITTDGLSFQIMENPKKKKLKSIRTPIAGLAQKFNIDDESEWEGFDDEDFEAEPRIQQSKTKSTKKWESNAKTSSESNCFEVLQESQVDEDDGNI
jgi:hypothetical protein